MFQHALRRATTVLSMLSMLIVLTIAALAQPLSTAWAQPATSPASSGISPTSVIPFDPAVTMATLPNGLRYYVRRNSRPEKRLMIQLVVKAGSVDETDKQQGLAHFL